ncbi:hypothetical protein C4J81_16810 [Deltaproteobacteria bacterium Smac51]|nr:hypothetical protein C4J81_16810 [Deltaproteobacteria bacterium Smac51]
MSLTVKQPQGLFRQIKQLAHTGLEQTVKPALERAGLAMSREAGLWPAFNLGLHFCAMYLALAVIVVGRGATDPDRAGVLIHFLTVPLAGLGLTLGLALGGRLWRGWPLMLGGGAVLGVVWMLSLSESGLSGRFSFLPTALILTVNWPVGLWLFFRTRTERAGLTLGLAMASGEMTWILLVPLLSAAFAGPMSAGQVLYIVKTLGLLPVLSALCLALITFRLSRDGVQAPAEAARPGTGTCRRPLGWLFVGGVCFFALFGLAWGSGLPRSVIAPATRENLHYFQLFGAPLAGWLLDRARFGRSRGLAALLAALVLAALAVPLSNLSGGAYSPAAFTLMNVARSSCLLLLFLGAARLSGRWLPLWGSLAYSIYLLQFLGAAAGRGLYGRWGSQGLILGEAGLTLGLALGLGCFWLTLRRETWPAPDEDIPAGDKAAAETIDSTPMENSKTALFTMAFELTGREAEVLAGLLRGLNSPALAESLGISERTLKYHLSGLLRKTGQPNRRRLAAFYACWSPADRP